MNGTDVIETQKKRDDIVAEIHERFPKVSWPTPILEPIFYGRLNKNVIEGKKLVLDKNTNNQLDIVSDLYELVYHEEVLKRFLDSIPEEFGPPKVIVNMFKYGARAHFTATFPELTQFEIKGSETHVQYDLKNSYDRSSFMKYSAGLSELVCKNGLRAFRVKERNSAKHIGENIATFNLKDKLRSSLENISESHRIWLGWAERKLQEAEVLAVVETLPYSEKEQEALLALPLLNHGGVSLKDLKGEATLWSVFSAGTQMVHELKSDERKIDIEEKLPEILRAQSRLAA